MQQFPLIIATRKSKLALWQANWVKDQILANDHLSMYVPELLEMESEGDLRLDQRLSYIGGKGLFTEDLERQIVSGKAHIAVHSLKDVPAQPNTDFFYRYTARHEECDVVVFPDNSEITDINDLPLGAVIGTSSVRRQALIANLYPHLQVKVLRGNVNTRLAKLNNPQEELDAIILAKAGLSRLGLLEQLTYQELDPREWVPAPGQGIVAVQFYQRNQVSDLAGYFGNDASSYLAEVERGISLALGGSCSLPIGVHMTYLDAFGCPISGKEVSQVWDEFITSYSSESYNPNNPANPLHRLNIHGAMARIFIGDFTGKCYRQIYRFDNIDLGLEPHMLASDERTLRIKDIIHFIATDIRANGFEEYVQSVDKYLAIKKIEQIRSQKQVD